MYKNLIDIVIPKPYNKTPNKRKIFQHNLFIDFFLKSCGPSHAFRKSFISSFVRQVSLLLNAFSPQKSATIFSINSAFRSPEHFFNSILLA